ncbi:MAG: hypothetical protein QM817_12030 [Archangium sp.]
MIDDAGWLVIADRLTEAGNPLGEFIVLTLKYENAAKTPELKKRRLRKLAREFEAQFSAKLLAWHRSSVTLSFAKLEGLLKKATALRELGVPLSLELDRGKYDSADRCWFDAGFTRLASVRHEMTITNINHSPGMDEDKSYSSEVKIYDVATRAQTARHFCDGWVRLEFRSDGLYAIDGERVEKLSAST